MKNIDAFLNQDTRVPNINTTIQKGNHVPITNTILPRLTSVTILDTDRPGDFAQIRFPQAHPKYPGKLTVLPKERLLIGILHRSNWIFNYVHNANKGGNHDTNE